MDWLVVSLEKSKYFCCVYRDLKHLNNNSEVFFEYLSEENNNDKDIMPIPSGRI
jgi:hypothetical protein